MSIENSTETSFENQNVATRVCDSTRMALLQQKRTVQISLCLTKRPNAGRSAISNRPFKAPNILYKKQRSPCELYLKKSVPFLSAVPGHFTAVTAVIGGMKMAHEPWDDAKLCVCRRAETTYYRILLRLVKSSSSPPGNLCNSAMRCNCY